MTAMQVNQGAFYVLVAHELLHSDDVDTIFQKMRGIRVAQHVGMNILEDACLPGYCFYGPLHATLAVAGIKAFAFGIARALKEILLWTISRDVGFNASDQVMRKRQVAVFVPLALHHVQKFTVKVQVL
jgi:hypothetical protein